MKRTHLSMAVVIALLSAQAQAFQPSDDDMPDGDMPEGDAADVVPEEKPAPRPKKAREEKKAEPKPAARDDDDILTGEDRPAPAPPKTKKSPPEKTPPAPSAPAPDSAGGSRLLVEDNAEPKAPSRRITQAVEAPAEEEERSALPFIVAGAAGGGGLLLLAGAGIGGYLLVNALTASSTGSITVTAR